MFNYDSAYGDRDDPPDVAPLVTPNLVWKTYSERPLYHPNNPDGLYLVRDFAGSRLCTIVMVKRNWSTKIGFSEYAYLGTVPDGWTAVTPA